MSEYGVIYADPPWRYNSGTARPQDEIENHYPTMPLDEIKALDVPAADDAILYLWTTAPHLEAAFEVIDAWGFTYKTNAVWDKRRIGLDHWFRIQHEHLLVASKGDAKSLAPEDLRSSVFRIGRGEHSVKPDAVRRHIEQAHPGKDKIELFARGGAVGWEVWGNEAETAKQDRLPPNND